MKVKCPDTIEDRASYIDYLSALLRGNVLSIHKYNTFMRGISLRHKISMDKLLLEEFREQADKFAEFMQRYEANRDSISID